MLIMETPTESLHLRLAALRKAAGVSQADMAERTGIDRSFLSHVERGRSSLRIDQLEQYLDAIGLRIMLVPAAPDLSDPEVLLFAPDHSPDAYGLDEQSYRHAVAMRLAAIIDKIPRMLVDDLDARISFWIGRYAK